MQQNPRNNVHKYEALEYDSQFNILAQQILFEVEYQKLPIYHSSDSYSFNGSIFTGNWGRNIGFQHN
jgi:hypothetical protein